MKETIGTLNIDFNRSTSQQAADIKESIGMGLSVLSVQEARDTFLHQVLPRGWETNQITSAKDKRGSAVCWDSDVWDERNRVSTLIFGVAGKGINPRWISVQNLRHRKTGKVVRFVSLHLPPRRKGLTELQAPMVNVLVALINRTRRQLVVAGDYNFIVADDKYKITERTGLVRRHNKIDGFYITPSLRPGPGVVGPDVNSPHRPVAVTITL